MQPLSITLQHPAQVGLNKLQFLLVIHSVSLYIATFTAPEHVACVVLSGICCFLSWSLFLHINHLGGSQRERGTPAVVLNYSCI